MSSFKWIFLCRRNCFEYGVFYSELQRQFDFHEPFHCGLRRQQDHKSFEKVDKKFSSGELFYSFTRPGDSYWVLNQVSELTSQKDPVIFMTTSISSNSPLFLPIFSTFEANWNFVERYFDIFLHSLDNFFCVFSSSHRYLYQKQVEALLQTENKFWNLEQQKRKCFDI